MDASSMKNMVVLKNLPSNMIEEAIVILKENKKTVNYQYMKEKYKDDENKMKNKQVVHVENVNNGAKKGSKSVKNNEKDYILKEAEMIITNYISELETKTPKWKNNFKRLEQKYRKSVRLNFILAFFTIVSMIISFI